MASSSGMKKRFAKTGSRAFRDMNEDRLQFVETRRIERFPPQIFSCEKKRLRPKESLQALLENRIFRFFAKLKFRHRLSPL
jgi:hypothetical protein